MKILKIEFQNINSLKGEHQIDFTATPFTGSSLFAITGPTGSGKSTLLDVICLALFNQVPRLGKISKNEILNKGALLTRNQKEAYAQVTYQGKSGTFVSHWSISTNSKGNLRDYEMQLFDLSSGKAMDLRKSDVPGKNEELIGLNYDQFIKSVLLAQGEFAQFLKARKDERGELLEKITGTGIYRQLGVQAFLKKKEVSAIIEKEQQEIALLSQQLLEQDERKRLAETARVKTSESEVLEKKIRSLEDSLQLKKEIEEQLRGIKTFSQHRDTATQALARFESTFGKSLQDHENLQNTGEDLRRWKQLKTVQQELHAELQTLKERDRANTDKLSDCLSEIRVFLKEDVLPDTIVKSLQDFSNQVMKLQKKRDEKLNSYQALQREFNTEVRDVPYKLNGDLKEAEDSLKELQRQLFSEIEGLKPGLKEMNLEDPQAEKQRLRKDLEKARKAEQTVQRLLQLQADLQALNQEIQAITPALQELPEKIRLEGAYRDTLKEKVQKLHFERENIRLRQSLEAHRANLHEGDPCPLCGALSHPYATGLPPRKDGLQEEIGFTEKQLAQKQDEVAGLQTRLEYHQQRLKTLQDKEKNLASKLQDEKTRFRKDFKREFSGEAESWSRQVTSLDRQMQDLEAFELKDRRYQSIAAGLPLLKDLSVITAQGKEIKNKLDLLYSGENVHSDCLDLQSRWTDFQHEKKSIQIRLKEIKEKLAEKTSEIQVLEKELLPLVIKQGCTGLTEAIDRLLPERKAAEYRKEKEEICAEIGRNEAALKTLKDQLEKLRTRDEEKTAEQIGHELQESKKKSNDLKVQCEEMRRKLSNDKETLERIQNIESGLETRKAQIRRWEILNQLIGDSTGKKFNDFAQDLSLTQLLNLANVRLRDLSDRYLLDKPLDGEDDSLVAIDEHMGGQRRSVKTLSGGETFILSLSMALALSDLASKNVEINSLFIDEGFGTLDPETLDQTLDTLEKLQAETSKTIGIISHVDSLKERIATQIRLQRNGQGYSSLSVSG